MISQFTEIVKVRGDPPLTKASVVSERIFGEIAKLIKNITKGCFSSILVGRNKQKRKSPKEPKKI